MLSLSLELPKIEIIPVFPLVCPADCPAVFVANCGELCTQLFDVDVVHRLYPIFFL